MMPFFKLLACLCGLRDVRADFVFAFRASILGRSGLASLHNRIRPCKSLSSINEWLRRCRSCCCCCCIFLKSRRHLGCLISYAAYVHACALTYLLRECMEPSAIVALMHLVIPTPSARDDIQEFNSFLNRGLSLEVGVLTLYFYEATAEQIVLCTRISWHHRIQILLPPRLSSCKLALKCMLCVCVCESIR